MDLAEKLKTTKISRIYRAPVITSVGFQIFALIFTSLLLDFGISFTIAAASLIPFWAAAVIIMLRRPISPIGFDRRFIAYGYPVLVFALSILNAMAGG